jgi:hypothetical protein
MIDSQARPPAVTQNAPARPFVPSHRLWLTHFLPLRRFLAEVPCDMGIHPAGNQNLK